MDLVTLINNGNSRLRWVPPFSSLSRELHRLLSGRGDTLAVAESLTAGLLQSAIAEASGSSAYFEGGVTTYSAQQKMSLLHADGQTCERYNCVHPMVAEDMAFGVTLLFGTTIGVATTGYAEPNPQWGIEHPMAYYCIYLDGDAHTGQVDGPGLGRNEMREYVARYVLNELIELLANRGVKP